MKQLSSLDLFYLVQEFKFLEDQRIETFYTDKDLFHMKVYVKGKGHFFLTNRAGKYLYVAKEKAASSTTPSVFAQHLRKYFKNSFLRKVEVLESERIVKITLDKKEDDIVTYHFFIELFGNGNVIVTDTDLVIKNALTKKVFKDRTVKLGEMYELPPARELSVHTVTKESFLKESKESDLSLVKFLALKLGIGGKYAEEIVARSKLDKNSEVAKLSDKDRTIVIKETKNLLDEKLAPKLILNDKKDPFDFIPFPFISITKESRDMATFNEVVQTYFETFKEEKDHREENYAKELKKLEKRLQTQLKQKESNVKDYEKNNEIGNKIYENYTLIEELLTLINTTAKDKGWEYVLKRVKSEEKLSKLISKLDYKKNEVILEIE